MVERREEVPVPEEDRRYMFAHFSEDERRRPLMAIQVNGQAVEMLIDSGASDNIIDEGTYQGLVRRPVLEFKATRNRSTAPTASTRI